MFIKINVTFICKLLNYTSKVHFKTLLRHVWGLVWVYLSHKYMNGESVFVYASCCYSVTVDTVQNSHDCTFIKYLVLFKSSPTKEAEADLEPLWLTFTSTEWPLSLRSKSCMTKMKTKRSPTLWLWQLLWWYLISTLISTLCDSSCGGILLVH